MTTSASASPKLSVRETFAFPQRPIPQTQLWVARGVAVAALAATVTLCVNYGWDNLEALGLLAGQAGLLGWIVFRPQRQSRRSTLTIDWRHRLFELHDYRLVARTDEVGRRSSREETDEHEVMTFEQLIQVEPTPPQDGTGGFVLHSQDTVIAVPADIERFDSCVAHVERVLRERGLELAGMERALAQQPPRPAPWWGWLILGVPVATLFFLVIRYAYFDPHL